MKRIYFDHAATTPVDKKVMKAMKPYFCNIFGNASSLHGFGVEAEKAVAQARKNVADFLSCSPAEIIFTSGATEANNLALMGMIFGHSQPGKKLHIITTAFEHPAVLEVCKHLGKINMAEVSYVKPEKDGVILVENIQQEIKENTTLISVMYANNEIGTIQPIKEIGEMVRKVNVERVRRDSSPRHNIGARNDIPLIFHTDAVQAALYCEMDVKKLGVDLLSLSGHKIYGPKGVGALYVKKGTPLTPVQFGGHHENGLRPGTLNVPSIVGLGKAVELIAKRDHQKIKKLRDYLWENLQKNITQIRINGNWEKRVPNNLNVSFAGVEGEALMLGLDLAGIAVSTGSACSSGSLEPSHVLMAIGLSHEEAHGSLRITLGKENTQKECDELIKKLIPLVERFRKMAPKN